MSSNTPEPSAKRRRVEVANSTLRKPFKSPLINGSARAGNSTPTPRRTTTVGGPVAAAAAAVAAKNVFPGAKHTASASASPLSLASRRSRPSAGNNGGGGEVAFKTATTKGKRSRPENPLYDTLLKAQRATAAKLKAVKVEMELVEQAGRIKRESNARRPGEEIDAELKEVTAKWKVASRLAAEELFELIKGRVESMGGARGVERRKREGDGFYGKERRRGEDEGGGGDGDSDIREEEAEEEEEKEEDENFSMLMMLKSLNIEPELLGWDPTEEKWLD
ncbi:hypothetical protein B0T16DRAFT_385285 [Cercophora newfieldiana]|uniref:Uncharacterized protein n=1 Tax=Cercophora newfieldiana TaxID=92897 RepID=A0AA40D116_9PEZI|nr:hypothetical protein B0T16DRAFT_385285 [Cercophora newfieldiana]